MKPPANAKLYEGELATFWFDEDDRILCAIAKNTPRTLERQKRNYAFVRGIIGDRKVCLLTETSGGSPQDKETREYSSSQLPLFFNAMAAISDTLYGQAIAKVFVITENDPIPIGTFSNEQDARNWLKQFL